MKNILEWLSGKKTYFIAAIVGIEAGLRAYGVEIPGFVDTALAALGLATVRAAVSKAS